MFNKICHLAWECKNIRKPTKKIIQDTIQEKLWFFASFSENFFVWGCKKSENKKSSTLSQRSSFHHQSFLIFFRFFFTKKKRREIVNAQVQCLSSPRYSHVHTLFFLLEWSTLRKKSFQGHYVWLCLLFFIKKNEKVRRKRKKVCFFLKLFQESFLFLLIICVRWR